MFICILIIISHTRPSSTGLLVHLVELIVYLRSHYFEAIMSLRSHYFHLDFRFLTSAILKFKISVYLDCLYTC